MMPMRNIERRLYEAVSDDFETGSDSGVDTTAGGWNSQKRTGRAAAAFSLFALACILVAFSSGSKLRATPAGPDGVRSRVSLVASDGMTAEDLTAPTLTSAPVVAATTKPAHEELGTHVDASLIPNENINDSNPCNDDEEVHLGLCYMKCSTLTQFKYQYRQSAWTCCNQATCSLTSMMGCCKHSLGFCSGYDIAGMTEGQAVCPHKPGACLTNEELFIGLCYAKCSDLTGGKYPHRAASATCCAKSDLTCIIPNGVQDGLDGQSNTSHAFDVGGGCGDISNFTHCHPHPPQQALTDGTAAATR